MQGKYANIIIDISHEKVDRPFQYVIPESLKNEVTPGVCVEVPFGAGNHLRTGYVIEVTDKAQFPIDKLKTIVGVLKNGITAEASSICLAAWIKKQYGSTMITALKTVLPVKVKTKSLEKKSVRLLLSVAEAEALLLLCIQKKQVAKERALRELLKEGVLPYTLLTGKLHVSGQTLLSLQKQGAIAIDAESNYRNPMDTMVQRLANGEQRYLEKKELNESQQNITDGILEKYKRGERKPCLIHGVTGSGKTEIYLALIEEVIKEGKQAIVLIPEIALTYQTVLRFYRRFGNRVSVMNSTLSQGEKHDQCERAKKGEIDVIVGPRSALFTPFEKLGIIIIDEEHESAYKSESMPKYHARETAIALARINKAQVVLGSATPSLEAYYRATKGEYHLFELTKRIATGGLPTVYTVDLREELKKGNRSIFSTRLKELIENRLEAGEQIMLFLNRRGYAGFISCRSCGHVMKCPHCDISLSEHKNGQLVCHYCGYREPTVKKCPTCESPYISGFRAGTEQIEELLLKQYPAAKVLRMDADTTRTKESYEKILTAFANREADILVGTQMIVKGHDFPEVTLVGILAADMSLHVNDYRAGERTFQLLTQAAGRAGRSDKPGEVVIQTYSPDHYSIIHAANQDYNAFYEEEIIYRELLLYPPAAHMLALLVNSKTEERAMDLAVLVADLAKSNGDIVDKAEEKLHIIGPAPAGVGRISDIYRYMIYGKSNSYESLVKWKDKVEQFMEEGQQEWKSETIQFDFDPMSAY